MRCNAGPPREVKVSWSLSLECHHWMTVWLSKPFRVLFPGKRNQRTNTQIYTFTLVYTGWQPHPHMMYYRYLAKTTATCIKWPATCAQLEEGPLSKKTLVKRKNERQRRADKTRAQDKRCVPASSAEGCVEEVFFQAYTCNMSVLDVRIDISFTCLATHDAHAS